ncbi:hypothetical protein Fmac_012765 [Flemingia macrophylla]|uniref:Uncharacterized protein n=1 Tax=Flemingia macrophylla TaxID=520843 RepID=A0ABD1MRA0_9FABA
MASLVHTNLFHEDEYYDQEWRAYQFITMLEGDDDDDDDDDDGGYDYAPAA